ncbi:MULTISPECIES: phage terminase small subunit P27 family [Actinosynnema]|uniref:phage terminase small subunit P27 family n=1 Tax=Actinosynnema TaxID=40566 RepID=UPI0020A5CD5A|nr:phage terminase small subunit P27 family [Actinosynnema pretiosum]
MGRRGPAAKPTGLRILHGDRADRINDAEPVPPVQDIACPDWASEDARAIWTRLAPGLEQRGVLTSWDVDAFLVLCEALSRYRQATTLINSSHLLVQGAGGLVKNPAIQIQGEAERTFLSYASRFGLTPSDRQSIKVEVGGDHRAKGGPGRLLS